MTGAVPLLVLALVGATHLVRKYAADPLLERLAAQIPGDDEEQVRRLRAWVPVLLSGIAWLLTVVLPLDVSVTDAATGALLTAVGAIATYDVSKAVRETVQVVNRRRELGPRCSSMHPWREGVRCSRPAGHDPADHHRSGDRGWTTGRDEERGDAQEG